MLGKFLKGLEAAKLNRKPAQAVAAPDISRVLRVSAPQQARTESFAEEATETYEPEVTAPTFEADPEVMETQAEEALDALTEEFEGWMRNDLEKMRDAWRVAQKPHAWSSS